MRRKGEAFIPPLQHYPPPQTPTHTIARPPMQVIFLSLGQDIFFVVELLRQWCKNYENPSNRKSHTRAPLSINGVERIFAQMHDTICYFLGSEWPRERSNRLNLTGILYVSFDLNR
jgi:hypothetical protein